MLRAKRVIIILAILISSSTLGFAQASGSVGLHLKTGISIPILRDWGWDYRGRGFTIAGGVSYDLSGCLTLLSNVGYSRYPFDREFYEAGRMYLFQIPERVEAGPTSVFSVTCGLKVKMPTESMSRVYLFGEFGLFRAYLPAVISHYSDRIGVTERGTKTGAMFDLGLGMCFRLNGSLNFFVESTFRSVLTKGQNVGDLRAFERENMMDLSVKTGVAMRLWN